ncbi:MAG: OsmC family protein [Bdellovibrionaceae bacterium]|nr:OsmC family protein [Pseudobdellovibrionaceae bacterium]
MVKMKAHYQGSKHCLLTHIPSSAHIQTDAPKDNHGKGECFSPTDLTAVSLLSCVLTTMAIKTEPLGYKLDDIHGTVEKIMISDPRRIGELRMQIHLPKSLSSEQRLNLENIAAGCPVKESLHPSILISTTYFYDM